MRVKDEIKRKAIMQATIELVNEIGFASSSVSKIAKRAQVSPATLYVYFENKEDLLVSTYIEIKRELGKAIMADFDPSLPIRESLLQLGRRLFTYIGEYKEVFDYKEQFANSPLVDCVDSDQVEAVFKPLYELIQRGIDEQIIKDVPLELIHVHLFYPIYHLANPRALPSFKTDNKTIDLALDMIWDALRR